MRINEIHILRNQVSTDSFERWHWQDGAIELESGGVEVWASSSASGRRRATEFVRFLSLEDPWSLGKNFGLLAKSATLWFRKMTWQIHGSNMVSFTEVGHQHPTSDKCLPIWDSLHQQSYWGQDLTKAWDMAIRIRQKLSGSLIHQIRQIAEIRFRFFQIPFKIFQEFMLLANRQVAQEISSVWSKLSLLRRHPPPKASLSRLSRLSRLRVNRFTVDVRWSLSWRHWKQVIW